MANIDTNHFTLFLFLFRLLRFLRLPGLPLSFSTRWHWCLLFLRSLLFFLRCITWFLGVVIITHSILVYYKNKVTENNCALLSLISDLDEDDGEAYMAAMQIDDISGVVLELEVNQ